MIDEVRNTKCEIKEAVRLVSLSENPNAEKLLGRSITDLVVQKIGEQSKALLDVLSKCYVCSNDPVKNIKGPIEAVQVAYIAYPNCLIIASVIAVRVDGEIYTC